MAPPVRSCSQPDARLPMRALLPVPPAAHSYYGAGIAAAPEEVDDMDIDSSNFSADKYVSSLLQHKSLPELMQRGIAMVSEIKSLDSDMQMLVCAHGASNRTQPANAPS